ncbi:hypothetical protein Hte_002269 [Hypoxylon texense]
MNNQANASSSTPNPSQTPPAAESKDKPAMSLIDSSVPEPNIGKKRSPEKVIRCTISKPSQPEPPQKPELLIIYRNGPFGRLHSIKDTANNVCVFHHERDADRHISMTFIHGKIAMLKDEVTGEVIYRSRLLD